MKDEQIIVKEFKKINSLLSSIVGLFESIVFVINRHSERISELERRISILEDSRKEK